MTTILALLVLSVLPVKSTTPEVLHYDLAEINHEYDDTGKLLYHRVILRDWDKSQFIFQDYRLIIESVGYGDTDTCSDECPMYLYPAENIPDGLVQKDWDTGQYIVTFFDGYNHYRIIVSQIGETWTQHNPADVELWIGTRLLPGERPDGC